MYNRKLQELKGSSVIPFLTAMSLPFPECIRTSYILNGQIVVYSAISYFLTGNDPKLAQPYYQTFLVNKYGQKLLKTAI